MAVLLQILLEKIDRDTLTENVYIFFYTFFAKRRQLSAYTSHIEYKRHIINNLLNHRSS